MMLLLLVLLALALLGGGFGHSRGAGLAGWSPAGIIVLVLVILAITGRL